MKIVIYDISYLYGKHPAFSACSQSVLYQSVLYQEKTVHFFYPHVKMRLLWQYQFVTRDT